MKKMIVIFINLMLMFVSIQFVFAQDPASAPPNPDFIKYLENLSQGKIQTQTAGGHHLGYIPPIIDLAHLRGQQLWPFSAQTYATSYDLREQNKLTTVKDQEQYGTCWAFASYGSLESALMPNESWDFSEGNMANRHGFDADINDGGSHITATAYLARWEGPVTEADDPYPLPDIIPTSPAGLSVKKHVQEVLFLPARGDSSDNNNIKQSIITYGAVYTAIYYDNNCYNSTHSAYYYNGTEISNHAITVVGWDDNYSRANFTDVPPGDGAFIMRNSWGTGWAEDGYFYISYYDSNIGIYNTVFNNAESSTNYYNIYQYDPLGLVGNYGYSSTTGWFANIFTAASAESLKAVGFYTGALDSSYEIYIYKDVGSDPIGGTPAATKTGTIAIAGYHTIVLDSIIPVASGQKFSVVVKLTTPGFDYPISYEYPYYNETDSQWYSSKATSEPGQSYVSPDGTSWSDITTITPTADINYAEANVCLKAYTGSTDTTAPSNIAYLNDGVGADIDTESLATVLSANWATSADTESGIARYWYGIGTTAGGTDLVNWTDVGVSTYVVRTGLSLTNKTRYYFTVKAENRAGLLSAVTNSDGQTFELLSHLKKVYNWPNPANPKTGQTITISQLPLEKTITIKIYNLAGELVKTLNDAEDITAGVELKTATWDGKNEEGKYVASGVYVYVVDTGDEQKVGKIAIVK